MKKILLVTLALITSACASEVRYRNTMEDLVGKKETQVFYALGKPDIDYKEGNMTYLYYQKTNDANAYTIPFIGIKCKTKIIINDRDVVSGYEYNGVCVQRNAD